MSSGFGESTSSPQPNPSYSSGNSSNNDAGDFECNICFDLAQDPVITLCGHLFCWPCLYKWLHYHCHSQECPVCKALVQEEKLVPLYGRGKSQTDPRNKSHPGMEIPRRPSGQRPQTASPPNPEEADLPPPDVNYHTGMAGLGLMGGFIPMATARFGNFSLSTGFGGFGMFMPSLLNIHLRGFQDATVYGTTSGYPLGFNAFQGGSTRGFNSQGMGQVQRQEDNVLKNLLMLIGFLVLITVIFVM